MIILSIYDKALGAYMQPWYAQSKGQAVRMFQDEIQREGSEMKKHPTDYELYCMGEWTAETGQFQILATPEHLSKGHLNN